MENALSITIAGGGLFALVVIVLIVAVATAVVLVTALEKR